MSEAERREKQRREQHPEYVAGETKRFRLLFPNNLGAYSRRMDANAGGRGGGSLPSQSAPASPAESPARPAHQHSAPTYQPFPSFPSGPQSYGWTPSSIPPAASPLGQTAFSAQSLASYPPSQDYRIPPFQPAFPPPHPHESPLETLQQHQQQHQANYNFSYPNHSLPRPTHDVAPPTRPPSNYTPLGAHTAKSAPPDWKNPRNNHIGASEQSGNWQERNRSAGESATTLPPSWEYAATPSERNEALARGLESAEHEAARWSFENHKVATRDGLWAGGNIPSPLISSTGARLGGQYGIEGPQQFRDGGYGDASEMVGKGNEAEGKIAVKKPRRKNGDAPRDTSQRRYACELCSDRAFARPSALAIHMVSAPLIPPHLSTRLRLL